MDIYILRDGSEMGPFSEETTQTMLADGSIQGVDYAWHPGLPRWLPLSDVLNAAPPALETPPPPPPPLHGETPLPMLSPVATAAHLPKAGEAATEKQKALLGYLGLAYSADLSKDQAALLINDAMEDAKHAGRLAQWNSDRLKLHPDLFAAEIQAKKESRASDFFELCQTEGADYFTKITKAHCQVLVGYLDVKFPNWDKDHKEAAQQYFFPAVAEKFPQLVAKAWQGKLRYATGPKIAAELSRQRPPTGQLRKRKTASGFPAAAIARGLFFGVVILAMFYFVQKVLLASGAKTGTPSSAPAAGSAAPEPTDPLTASATSLPPAEAAAALPPDPLMAANTATPTAPAEPTMTAAESPAPKPSPLPGFPPDPPATGGSLLSSEPTPPTTAAPPPVAEPAPAPAKTNLKLTRPVEVQLIYGKMKLPIGTPVKLVSREGNVVKVNYLNTILTVPVTSTDLGDGAPAMVPAPAPTVRPADF